MIIGVVLVFLITFLKLPLKLNFFLRLKHGLD
ncbi:hypothetical protein L934_05475 [Helicobacter pylori PZ5080]|uniref:Uncharacterized protein n=1 Tax=Helicobacter pylori PZ5080 TaxID=1337394 RepID=T2SP61_HELPX|nr:hypothetical protein L934_05475 [Helicobacter pylori PZ5080]